MKAFTVVAGLGCEPVYYSTESIVTTKEEETRTSQRTACGNETVHTLGRTNEHTITSRQASLIEHEQAQGGKRNEKRQG